MTESPAKRGRAAAWFLPLTMACGIALMVAGLSSGGEPELPAGAVLRVGEVSLGAEEILRRAGSDSETTAAKAIEQVVVDEALFQRGVALGLVTSDAIIRRRVVEAVRSLVTAEEAAREPSEEELRAYHERHKKLFTGEPRYRLSEMVLASGRGPEPRILRETIQEGLRSGESFKDLSIEHGDTSFSCFEPGLGYTEGELVATRGRAFSRAVKATPVRRLSPPVPGPGGVHLVRVEEVLRGDLLSFDEARAAVLNRWRRNASLEAFAHYVEEVRSEAEVWVAPDAEARVGRALESRGVISP